MKNLRMISFKLDVEDRKILYILVVFAIVCCIGMGITAKYAYVEGGDKMATRVWVDYDVQPDGTFKKAIPIDEIHRIEIWEYNSVSFEIHMYQSGETDDYEVYDVGADNDDGETFSTLALAQAAVAVLEAL